MDKLSLTNRSYVGCVPYTPIYSVPGETFSRAGISPPLSCLITRLMTFVYNTLPSSSMDPLSTFDLELIIFIIVIVVMEVVHDWCMVCDKIREMHIIG